MKNFVFIILTGLVFSACSSSYFDSNVFTKYTEGKELYMSKCSGCHFLHSRNEFDAKEWDEVLSKMQKKAKIDYSQADMIYNFLTEKDSTFSNLD